MMETRTTTMLQRVPAILAVTANSYGLAWQANGSRKPAAAGERRGNASHKAHDKPSAQR